MDLGCGQRVEGSSICITVCHTAESLTSRFIQDSYFVGSSAHLVSSDVSSHHHTIAGLDVVPLHPDLIQVGSFDLASRITWVQANL